MRANDLRASFLAASPPALGQLHLNTPADEAAKVGAAQARNAHRFFLVLWIIDVARQPNSAPQRNLG